MNSYNVLKQRLFKNNKHFQSLKPTLSFKEEGSVCVHFFFVEAKKCTSVVRVLMYRCFEQDALSAGIAHSNQTQDLWSKGAQLPDECYIN